MNEDLVKEIWNEQGVTELLGCSKKQLRRLTLEAGLPAVRLQPGLYVYVAADLRKWLMDRATAKRPPVAVG